MAPRWNTRRCVAPWELQTVSTNEREQHLFIVRIWRERSSGNGSWRGSAKHIESGRVIVSADIDEITDFIRVRLMPEADCSTDGKMLSR